MKNDQNINIGVGKDWQQQNFKEILQKMNGV
jgi:hypothetical protein